MDFGHDDISHCCEPTDDPPGQIGGTDSTIRRAGAQVDFVTAGKVDVNNIDTTFDGIGCDGGSDVRLPFRPHPMAK